MHGAAPVHRNGQWDPEARRLLWRCRRGMKELDVLLERYVRSQLPELAAEDRATLGRLLELPDPTMADFLLGQARPSDPPLSRMVEAIRAFRPASGQNSAVRQSPA